MTLTSPPDEIKILTLNCWGLKFLAKWRRERLAEIGRLIGCSSPPPQIVGLQECWTQEDYLSIREQTKHILPYGKFYFSGIFGGGLAILSKWPIEESNMYRYPLNGRPTAFFRGDWFVGKGVACARIRFGPRNDDVAEVFCTHLHAPYESEPNDSYICHRTAQAWEIAKLMRGAAERGHLVVGLGDFNMVPLSFAHRLITTHAPVEDVWRVLHPDSSIAAAKEEIEQKRGKPIPTADFNLTENGATCDGKLNTWRWTEEQRKALHKGKDIDIPGHEEDPRGRRLDYIFIGSGNPPTTCRSCSKNARKWVIRDAKVSMTERHPTLRCSLSDHFAVEATIYRETPTSIPLDHPSPEIKDERFELTIGDETLENVRKLSANEPLPPSTYSEILAMISSYEVRERFQRRMRLSNFGISCVVSIGSFVAIWWSPRNFVSFLILLVCTLGFGAGVVDGLIGGLFVGSELRALKEFEWEIKTAKQIAEGGPVVDIALREW